MWLARCLQRLLWVKLLLMSCLLPRERERWRGCFLAYASSTTAIDAKLLNKQRYMHPSKFIISNHPIRNASILCSAGYEMVQVSRRCLHFYISRHDVLKRMKTSKLRLLFLVQSNKVLSRSYFCDLTNCSNSHLKMN